MTPLLYPADLLYTGMGLPQRAGGVVVSQGTVAATGPLDELRLNFPQALEQPTRRVISPPPVNAHAHLDMSLYQFRALPYFQWIPEVVMAGRFLRGLEGAQAGLKQLRASGAAALGDIVWHPEVMDWLLREGELPGVAYWEVLDPNPATAEASFARARERLDGWRRQERPGGMRVGLSPHASYTVSHRLLRLLAEYAGGEGLPMQIHVSEHPAESEFFASGTGPLADGFLRSMQAAAPGLSAEGIFGRAPDQELTATRYLADLGVLDARPTLVHMVAVTEDDVRTVAQAGCAVVSCPRSNANLECGPFRWADFAAAGVEVALGTDSVASGETLDIHDELRAAVRAHPGLDPRQLVRAAVKGGARVLGQKAPFIRRGEVWNPAFLWPQADAALN